MKLENDQIVIKVIGVGGAGIVITNGMIRNGIKNVQFYAVDADVKALRSSIATEKVLIGTNLTRGLGTGSDVNIGYRCAIEDQEKLQHIVKGADLVYIVTGLGGGIGTGASPVIAELAKKTGALTIVFVTKPFNFEGKVRIAQAEKGIRELEKIADLLIVFPNQKIIENISPDTSLINAFRMVDNMACQIFMSIYDVFIYDNEKNTNAVNFDDIKKLLTGKGLAFVGIGEELEENKVAKLAQKAISDLGLDNDQLQKVNLALVNITGVPSVQMAEIDDVIYLIRSKLKPKVNIIWTVSAKEEITEKVRVFLMVAGSEITTIDRVSSFNLYQ